MTVAAFSGGATAAGLFDVGPLGGVIGASTCSIYRLDPTGSVPVEPLLDLVPGVTPMRVTLDMIDGEKISESYDITTHAIADIADATSNVHRKLAKMTIAGTLTATLPTSIAGIPIPFALPNPLGLLRLDLIRLQNVRAMARLRRPVLVVTPRYALQKAFIESVESEWNPEAGESTNVSISFVEARVVRPSIGPPIAADFSAQLPGNNAASAGGAAAGAGTGATAFPSSTPGVPPVVSRGVG